MRKLLIGFLILAAVAVAQVTPYPPTSGGCTVANPTGTVGLTAVNGSATTCIRSDGAPALSQSIAPTWTGQHIFGAPVSFAQGTSYSGSSWTTAGIGLAIAAATF